MSSTEWISSAISAAAVVFSAIIGAAAARDRKDAKKKQEEVDSELKKNAALVDGVRSLLKDRIIQAHGQYTELNQIPIHGMESIISMYAAYHDLGGNGTITQLVVSLKELPVSD